MPECTLVYPARATEPAFSTPPAMLTRSGVACSLYFFRSIGASLHGHRTALLPRSPPVAPPLSRILSPTAPEGGTGLSHELPSGPEIGRRKRSRNVPLRTRRVWLDFSIEKPGERCSLHFNWNLRSKVPHPGTQNTRPSIGVHLSNLEITKTYPLRNARIPAELARNTHANACGTSQPTQPAPKYKHNPLLRSTISDGNLVQTGSTGTPTSELPTPRASLRTGMFLWT